MKSNRIKNKDGPQAAAICRTLVFSVSAIIFSIQAMFLCIGLSGCASNTVKSAVGVRYDGLYALKRRDNPPLYEIMRFYPDGIVVYGPVSATPNEVMQLLHEDTKEVSHGRYVVQGSALSFSTFRPNVIAEGRVDFSGTIMPDRLLLNIYSHISGYRATVSYNFVRGKKEKVLFKYN